MKKNIMYIIIIFLISILVALLSIGILVTKDKNKNIQDTTHHKEINSLDTIQLEESKKEDEKEIPKVEDKVEEKPKVDKEVPVEDKTPTENKELVESSNENKNKVIEITTTLVDLNIYGNDLIIKKGGEYTLNGTLNNSIFIDSNETVQLNLNNVTIHSKTNSSIINIRNNNLIINILSNTTNTIKDFINKSEYDGAIFSNGPIIIKGEGTLIVNGNQIDGEGIATKNSPITIESGNITINSIDDGLNTGGTGGTITINNGNLTINSGGDGIDSNKDIIINGGNINITSSLTSLNSIFDTQEKVTINGGTIIGIGMDTIDIHDESKQQTIFYEFQTQLMSKNKIEIVDNTNKLLLLNTNKRLKNIFYSSPNIKNNYQIYLNDNLIKE